MGPLFDFPVTVFVLTAHALEWSGIINENIKQSTNNI